MNKVSENLTDIFDLDPVTPQEEPQVVEAELVLDEPKEVTSTDLANIEDDAEFARKNIRELIRKGSTAIDGILSVAEQSEKARDYEVAGGLIKHLADLNKDLMDIHKKKKDVAPVAAGSRLPGVSVDKAIFVGSTTELIKLIKQQKAQE